MGKYIDGSGLSHFMGIIKGALAGKADVSAVPIGSSTSPKMNGTATVGTETKWAHGDHIHPSDTTRVPTSRKVNGQALSADVTLTSSNINYASSSDTITDMIDDLQEELNGIASGAEVNQNAFSNVKVGNTTIAADTKTDTLELVAGSNVTLTPDATNDKVTIAATDTTALGSMTGTLGVGHGGTGVSTLGAGVVYHSASGTGALSIATAANLVSALGTTAVNRATADANGDNIANTYARAADVSEQLTGITDDIDNALSTKAPLASPALTGTPTAPTAAAGTNTTQIATTAFVTNAVGTATAGALQYKGTVSAESTITGASYKKGWYYVVATAGTYVGKVCEVGDMLIAKQDKTSTPSNDWDAIQSNIEILSNSEIDTLWAAA